MLRRLISENARSSSRPSKRRLVIENLESREVMNATYHVLSGANFTQDWTNTGLITANDNWTGVPSIIGYLGDDAATSVTGADPQTLLGTYASEDVIANQTNPNTNSTGGVAEFEITNPVVALQGSATADAPYIQLHIDSTGIANVKVEANIRDIDGSADNTNQQLAVQYRIGNSGNFVNVPSAYIGDASTGPSLATLVTPISVTLPAAAGNQSQLQIRFITSNAASGDEWIGIDDIVVSPGTAPLANVGNLVYYDVNENNAQDAGELGVLNTPVTLLGAGPNNTFGDGDDLAPVNTTTSANGGYLFTNVAPGKYRVQVTPNTTMTSTLPSASNFVELDVASTDIDTVDIGLKSALLINEINADTDGLSPDSNGNGAVTDADEFVEIVNQSAAPVDISGFVLREISQERHIVPAGTILLPGQALVVFGAAQGFDSVATVVQTNNQSGGDWGLGTSGDRVTVMDASRRGVAAYEYVTVTTDDQSSTRNPDLNRGQMVLHATAQPGTRTSPGKKIDGTPFIPNAAPTAITPSASTVAENSAAVTTVGTFSTTDPTDPNPGEVFTYALVAGTGSEDNAQFTITGNTLRTAASFDFETKSSYKIRVESRDAGGLAFEQELTITVTNANDAPTGTVTIDDTTPATNQLLTAANTLADADGLGAISYAWERADDAAFTTAVTAVGTGATFTPGAAEAGKFLRVTASYTDGGGNAESVTSAVTAAVNSAATGTVTIDDPTPAEDQLLTAANTLADANGLGAFTYTWERANDAAFTAGVTTVGTNAATFTPGDAEVGKFLRVTISYTDGNSNAESVSSAVTAAVTNVNDAPTGTVTIDDTTPSEGQLLTASNTLADADGLGAISYAWERADDAAFTTGVTAVGTGATFTPGATEVGKFLRVTASYTDGNGTAESVSSAVTTPVNSAPTGAVTIDDPTPTEDQLLTAANTLADADGLGAISYAWERANDAAFTAGVTAVGTGATFTPGDTETGKFLRVTASYTDGNGTAESITSAVTAAVINVNDAVTGVVTIDDTTPTEDQLLTAANTLADIDGLGAISYAWERADDAAFTTGVTAVGTGATFTSGDAEVGKFLRVTASYTDGNGTAESVTSAVTAAVTNVNDAPTGTVTIDDTTPAEDQLLTASNTLADIDGLGAISYSWERADDSAFTAGVTTVGTGATFTPGDAEVGRFLRVTASYTDGGAAAESVSSAVTAAVANVNDAVTGTVTIDDTTPAEDQLLTASNTLADIDGLGTISYAWERANDAAFTTGVTTVGTGSTFTPGDAEVGRFLRVTASYTDGGAAAESVSSAVTAAVSNVNDAPTDLLLSNATVAENLAAGATVGTVTTTDADTGDTFTYTLTGTGNDNASFVIHPTTGALTTAARFDFETQASYTVHVTSQDAGGQTVEEDFTITVTNANDAPVITSGNAFSVAESNTTGLVGPSTTTTPYLTSSNPNVQFTSVMTVGDAVSGYRMVGIPDGMGAFDNNDGTFTLLLNHELVNTVGGVRAHGQKGAFVSRWVINKSTLQVVSIRDFLQDGTSVFLSNNDQANNTTHTAYLSAATTVISRLCSADLAPVGAYQFDDGLGTVYGTAARIFQSGEESSGSVTGVGPETTTQFGRQFAFIATDDPNTVGINEADTAYEIPHAGLFAWENNLASPLPQRKTIVMGMDDGSPIGQVYMWVGDKQTTGNVVERAGLTKQGPNDNLYVLRVPSLATVDGNGVPIETTGAPVSGAFTMVNEGDVSGLTFAGLEALSDAAGATQFLRPEDGQWDPDNPSDFYFLTTSQYDQTKDGVGSTVGRSRLYRLRFTDITNPELGGTITAMLDGTEAGNMFDNMTLSNGKIIIQEDVGNQEHSSRVWSYDIAGDTLTELAQHDRARFGDVGVPATAPFSRDEESSGVIDVSDILGDGSYLVNVQAHYNVGDAELVEGGQLLVMKTEVASGKQFVTTVTASDVESNTLAFAISGGVDMGDFVIDPDTGALSFAVAPNFEAPADDGGNNEYVVEVSVTDGVNPAVTQTVTVTVTNVNESPSNTTVESVSVAENTTAVLTATGADPEGVAPVFAISGGADAARFAIIPATGALSFVTAPNFEAPTDNGANNTYFVTVTVSDGVNPPVNKTVVVTVTNANDAPAAAASSFTTNEDTPKNFAVPDFQFTDADTNPLASITVSNLNIAVGDTLTVDQGLGAVPVTNGMTITALQIPTLLYTPAADASGAARSTFDFTVNDAGLGTVSATMSINVTAVNDGVPVAQTSSVTTNEDVAMTFAVADFLFTDADNDALVSITIGALTLGAGDTLTVNTGTVVPVTNGMTITAAQIPTIVYTPAPDASGAARSTFDFTVNDAGLGTVSATMTINVTAVNDVPVAQPSSVTTSEDVAKTFALADFLFTDADNDALASVTVGIVTLGAGDTLTVNTGTVVPVTTGMTITAAQIPTIVYTPASNASGVARSTFDFTVNDAVLGTVPATMTINVTAVNDVPVAQPGSVTTNEDVAMTFAVADFLFTDADNDALVSITIGALTLGAGDTLTVNTGTVVPVTNGMTITAAQIPTIVYTPAANATGTPRSSFEFRVNDAGLGTVAATMSIIVTALADAPVIDTEPGIIVEIIPAKATVFLGSPVSVLTANISDPDAGAAKGIAITAAPPFTVNGKIVGRWEFSTDGGANWNLINGATPANALLLSDIPANRVRFKPVEKFTFSGFPSLSYKAWDTTVGTSGTTGDSTVAGTAFSAETEKASVAVGKTSPAIDPEGNPLFTSILKDSKNPAGDMVKTVLGLFASDNEKKNVVGMAVTDVDNADGKWQYMVAGKWTDIPAVSETSALLLAPTAKVRFLPDAGFFGQATLGYHVWDQSAGKAGELAVVAGTAFSVAKDFAAVHVVAKPVLDISVSRTLASANDTALVGDLLDGAVTDVLPGDVIGIAVTGLTGKGVWSYKIGANTAVPIKAATLASAILLPDTAVLSFAPAAGFAGVATLQYRAWNATTLPGVAGAKANASGNAFGAATETLSLFVPAAANTAPVIGVTAVSLGKITEDPKTNAGVTVKSLVTAAKITDADKTDKTGIALTAADAANGIWQYSLDGKAWADVGVVSATAALALADTARLRFVPDANYFGTPTAGFTAWDGTAGASGDVLDTTAPGSTAFGGTAVGTLTVSSVNDSPVLDNSGVRFLPLIAAGETSGTVTVADLVAGSADVETPAADLGIAVWTATGPGKWQVSTDGIVPFVNLTKLPALLGPAAVLRFVGDTGKTGLAAITYRAWDRSSGGPTAAAKADALSAADHSARETLTVEVGNQKPSLTGPGKLTALVEDQKTNAGDTVAKLLGTTFADLAVGKKGIAVTLTADSGIGEWQYSIDAGKTWKPIGTRSETSALLLSDTAKVRFLADKDESSASPDEPTLTYKAWDQTAGASGEILDTTDGDLNAFSDGVQTAKITITAVFDAPTLNTGRAQLLVGTTTVDGLLDGAVSSPEATTFGIAITGLTGKGTWFYKLDAGSAEVAIVKVSAAAALLLPDTAILRFEPATGFKGLATLTYKAWDVTGSALSAGGKANTSAKDIKQYFSTAVETLSVNIGNTTPGLVTL